MMMAHRPTTGAPRPRRRSFALLAGMAFALTVVLALPAGADRRLFRPLTADPRESQTRWRAGEFVEDWRYGTDITDSTSTGGFLEDVEGVSWEASVGETFRWRPFERLGGWRGPWEAYQLGAPVGIFMQFASGTMLNADYQYGISLDVLWRGDYDPAAGISDFSRTAVTTRFALLHKSSHLGDEYIAYGAFGRNRDAASLPPALMDRPPVKRVELASEILHATLSLERALGAGGPTLRAYGGGEFRLAFPDAWGFGGTLPRGMKSPAWRGGLELRSAGDAGNPHDGAVTKALSWLLRDSAVETEWFGAVDVRVAKPFNFAGSDSPDGETEVWTPYLWTLGQNGREFRNPAASWHGMVGWVLSPHARRLAAGGRMSPEFILALEWYRGYSPNGQFLDQRMRYQPRWGVVPSFTAHF